VSLILVRRFAQKNRGSADPWLGCSYGKTGTGRPEPNRSQIYYKMRTDRPTPTGMKSLITDGRKFLPPSSRDRRSLLHHAFTPMSAIKGWRNRRLGTRRANPTQGGRLVYLSARACRRALAVLSAPLWVLRLRAWRPRGQTEDERWGSVRRSMRAELTLEPTKPVRFSSEFRQLVNQAGFPKLCKLKSARAGFYCSAVVLLIEISKFVLTLIRNTPGL
jgi:hypothetical protein